MTRILSSRQRTKRLPHALLIGACAVGALLATPTLEAAAFRDCQSRPAARSHSASSAIVYAYCLVLGREPDGAGMDTWRVRIGEGTKVEQVILEMLHSDEFARKNRVDALSPTDYTALVHRLLLGRDPDAASLERVGGSASKEATGPIEQALIASDEFRRRHPALFADAARNSSGAQTVPEVKRACDLGAVKRPLDRERGQVIYSYCLVLGRWPDAYGLNTWLAEMRVGLTLPALLVKLLNSDEFATKYRVAELGNEEFVTLAYRLLLGRDPDGQGLQSYGSALAKRTLSISTVYDSIVASDEFRTKQDALFTARKLEPRRAELGEPAAGSK